MKTLHIGFIGAGNIVVQRHLPGLRSLPDIVISAVANSTSASARAFCNTYAPEAKVFEHWEDIIALPEIDIIWIGATPNLHKAPTLAALENGKHVFCQARMARNLAEAMEMLAASQAHRNLVTMLCPPPYGLRYDAYIKKFLAEGNLGEMHHLCLESLNDAFLDPWKPVHWRQRSEINGLNCLTLGIYVEVLHRWFGQIRSVKASGKIFTPKRGDYDIKIPDQLDVLAEFESGLVGSLQLSSVHSGTPIERLTITGRKGVLVYDFARDVITFQKLGQAPERLNVPQEYDRPWQVEADFINAVRNPSCLRPHPNFEDGVAYMRVVQETMRLIK